MAQFSRVDAGFFDALGVPLLTGRSFQPADTHPTANAVIVNRAFVQKLLADGDALGRSVRYVGMSSGRTVSRRVRYVGMSRDAAPEHVKLGRWYEIVGVVPDVPARTVRSESSGPKLYHAAAPGQLHPAILALRVRGGAPVSFAGRLREVAATIDPNPTRSWRSRCRTARARSASASPLAPIAAASWRRSSPAPSRRSGAGIAAGGFLVFLLTQAVTGLSAKEVGVVTAYMALMMAVCLLACVVPTGRALAVEPTEALRAD